MKAIEHFIQRDILGKLCFNDEVRFTDLKPKNLESNVFMYHLKQLIKANLVAKNKNGQYALTPQGLAYVDKISFTTKRPALQPKIVNYLQVTDKQGAQLFWRRKIQPSINQVGVPIGKTHFGEDLQQSAQRELFEKTGLKNIEIDYKGTASLKFYIEDTLVSHLLCLIFSGQTTTIQPKLVSGELGEVFWSKDCKIDGLLPSVPYINEQIKTNINKYFFTEKSFYLN